MAIRIGPDKALGGKAKPRGSQPQQRQQDAGQREAARRTEQRRDRDAADSRRDAEGQAADAEDLADFGDVEDDELDGGEYGMGGGDGLTNDDRDDLGLGPGDTEQSPARPTSLTPDPTSDGDLSDDDRDDFFLGPGDAEQAPAFPTALTDPPAGDGGLTDANLAIEDDPDPAPTPARSTKTTPRDRPADTGAADLDAVQTFGGPQQAMAQGTAYDGMDVLEGPQQGQAVGRVYLGQPDRPAETGLLDVGDDELHQEQPADPPPTFAERRRAALLDRFEDVPAFRTSLVDAAGRHIKAGRDRAEAELVGLGQNVEAVHTDAWGFYDRARGALDDDYAPPPKSPPSNAASRRSPPSKRCTGTPTPTLATTCSRRRMRFRLSGAPPGAVGTYAQPCRRRAFRSAPVRRRLRPADPPRRQARGIRKTRPPPRPSVPRPADGRQHAPHVRRLSRA